MKPLWTSRSVEATDPAQNEAKRRRAQQIQDALRQAKNPQEAARILHDFS
jgi:UDP:flavonoid glycosyltransferase YjiC (YdhE family)